MRHRYLALAALFFVTACSFQNKTPQGLTVVTTFFPLYDLTRAIVGDRGTVTSIIAAGIEPHDFEPNPSDLQKVSSADVYVAMGLEFDAMERDFHNVNPAARVISASAGISLLQGIDDDAYDEPEGEVAAENKGIDPHIWLSLRNAQVMAENIMNELAGFDPDNGDYYLQKGEALIAELKSMDSEFRAALSSCAKDVVLVNHNAFAYLARDYGFRTITIHGLEPETEPTPQQLARLVAEARKHGIKYVFYEALVDPRIARTIAQEVGAEAMQLDPLEGSDDAAATYLSLMRINMDKLRVALECE